MDKKVVIEEVTFLRKGKKWEVRYSSNSSAPFCPIFGEYDSCEKCGYFKNGKCIIRPNEIDFEELIYRIMKNVKKQSCVSITIKMENKDIKRGSKVF